MLPLLDHETLFRESERKWEQTSDRERVGERTEKNILYTQFKLTQVWVATGVTGV